MAAFDFKRERRDLYQPKRVPHLIEVPEMRFVCVEGEGDPNEEEGAYAHALSMLYAIAYTLKMSYKTDHVMEGFFPYVVPPLEGFWWQPDVVGVDLTDKASFRWVSALRVPDFVGESDLVWARAEAARKKKLDCREVELRCIEEGLCVQCMHVGPYDTEPVTVEAMDLFAVEAACELDFSDVRRHHEIYLSDPRKSVPEKLRTIIRHPVRRR